MTADSVRPADPNHHRMHSRLTGRLYRGQGVTAASASIPSRYQTIVTDNSDEKGFSCQAKRFNDDIYMSEIPGPGNYQCLHGDIEKQSASFSKRGTGSFASKTPRAKKTVKIPMPGAASYTLPSMLTTRREFNQATSTRCFHQPIAVNADYYMQFGAKKYPAPNLYHINNIANSKHTTVSAQAAFKSRTKREGISVGRTRIPSPSHYNIQTDKRNKGPMSSFFSKTKRVISDRPPDFPGPGTYKPFELTTPPPRQLFPRRHYLGISAPAMPLPPPVPNPGPGTYELVDYEGPPKHYMSSGVFVSNSSRWTSDHIPSKDNPGPSTYRPEKIGKQSFLYNSQNRWIPA